MSRFAEQYELFYWSGLPGRGEVVRMTMAAAGVSWKDTLSNEAVMFHRKFQNQGNVGFAPPYIQDQSNGLVLAQLPAILQYIGEKHGLSPSDPASKAVAMNVTLTIADIWQGFHDCHHPVSIASRFEVQRDEAIAYTKRFIGGRIKQFFVYFNELLKRNGGRFLCGGTRIAYCDIFMFQTLEGLAYAFPRAYRTLTDMHPLLYAYHNNIVSTCPRLAEYLEGPRRIAFNQQGIFRKYPELNIDINK